MVDSTTKTWRAFLFGICCGFLAMYIERALIHLQLIRGALLSDCIAVFLAVWSIFSFARIYYLDKRYPEHKNNYQEDKYCMIGFFSFFTLAIWLQILPD